MSVRLFILFALFAGQFAYAQSFFSIRPLPAGGAMRVKERQTYDFGLPGKGKLTAIDSFSASGLLVKSTFYDFTGKNQKPIVTFYAYDLQNRIIRSGPNQYADSTRDEYFIYPGDGKTKELWFKHVKIKTVQVNQFGDTIAEVNFKQQDTVTATRYDYTYLKNDQRQLVTRYDYEHHHNTGRWNATSVATYYYSGSTMPDSVVYRAKQNTGVLVFTYDRLSGKTISTNRYANGTLAETRASLYNAAGQLIRYLHRYAETQQTETWHYTYNSGGEKKCVYKTKKRKKNCVASYTYRYY